MKAIEYCLVAADEHGQLHFLATDLPGVQTDSGEGVWSIPLLVGERQRSSCLYLTARSCATTGGAWRCGGCKLNPIDLLLWHESGRKFGWNDPATANVIKSMG